MVGQRNKRKFATLLVAGACSLCVAQAGEKLELKSSTTIELPKPREFDYRRNAPNTSTGPSVDSGSFTPVAPPPPPTISKKLKELNDKRNNWIFLKPEELLMDEKTSTFFNPKENNSTLLDFNTGADKSEKNAQQRFWEDRDKMSNPDMTKDSPESRQRMRFEMMKQMERNGGDLGDNREKDNKPQKTEANFGNAKQGAFLEGNDSRDAATSFDYKTPDFVERGFGGMFADKPRGISAFDKDEIKKREAQRDADFSKMLQPRSQLATGGPTDPLNTQIDSTRIDANPILGRRAEFGADYNSQSSFLDNDRPGSIKPEISGTSISDLLPKAPSASAFAPAVSASPSVQSPISASRPFIFEIPRRAF